MSGAAHILQASHAAAWRAPVRFVTAVALCDGHDAAINVVRRLLLDEGAEVIHLGHSRGVDEIVRAAPQEDADAIAVSSYQGDHVEFFRYLIDTLTQQVGQAIRVFGGGGGTITQLGKPAANGLNTTSRPRAAACTRANRDLTTSVRCNPVSSDCIGRRIPS